MKRDRKFWYAFFADLGFMIVPYAHNWHSTTYWGYDCVEIGEEIHLPESDAYKITRSATSSLFYALDQDTIYKALDGLQQVNQLFEEKLKESNIVLKTSPWRWQRIHDFPGKTQVFFETLAQVITETDPLSWVKEGVAPHPIYANDFDTYGFMMLYIQKIPVT